MWAKPKQRSSQIISVPAPTKGLNDTDSLANMDPMYAVSLLNLFPNNRSLQTRNGYTQWTSSLPSSAKTLLSFSGKSGGLGLFAATDSGMYNISTVNSSSLVTALTNGRGSYVNYSNIAGQYMVFVNGVDPGKLYDGATWINFTTVVTPVNPGEVSGADMATMIYVHAHKKRLWFVQKNTATAWYLPTDSVGGALTPFYLGGVFLKGGSLTGIMTWSVDAGDGLDDILIFQSSSGEIAGYAGSDPNVATAFLLEAVYDIGASITDRTHTDLGGELLLLTVQGLFPISKIIGGQQLIGAGDSSLTKNISRTLNEIVVSRASSVNWELMNIPSLQALFLNIPNIADNGAQQFVMNTLTGAWTRYDLPALTVGIFNGTLFFSDQVSNIWFLDPESHLDGVNLLGLNGAYIQSWVQPAHNYFQLLGTNKLFGLIRPLIRSTYYPAITYNIGTDFQPNSPELLPVPSYGPLLVDTWDQGTWDISIWNAPAPPLSSIGWDIAIWDTDIWSPPSDTQYQWLGAVGMGYSASLALRFSTNVSTELIAIDWTFTPGASL